MNLCSEEVDPILSRVMLAIHFHIIIMWLESFCIFLIVLYLFILLIICYIIFNNTLLWNRVLIIYIHMYYINYIEVIRYII